MTDKHYALFEEQQKDRGIDIEKVKSKIKQLKVETPSWGFGDSGTRFKVFEQEGVPRDPFEKFEDAAQVHKFTGTSPSVAIHIPWDKVDDYKALKSHAESLDLSIGAVNPNLFQDNDYKFGSVTNVDASIRQKATDHLLECVDIAKEVDSKIVSLWFADGTNYPGQADFRQRKKWMQECLQTMYDKMHSDMRMLIEYKFFEPAFYHTDLADWGMAFNMANKLGPNAEVLVDTGHHPQATNIEHIVAYLLDEKRLGGFHFNSRKYADDDLIVAAHNPHEIYLILQQIVAAEEDSDEGVVSTAGNIAYMLDQCHNVEPKIPAMIRSILNVQNLYAKACLVNLEELKEAQEKQDVLRAEQAVREAYECDVTPLLQAVREEMGAAVDPMKAYQESGYAEKILTRGKGGASW
ncbi:L-rhamnose isomerase/sugar isomerase [Salibacterium salarium]|uniref:L-rhamnose isomerase n=1 Tax=Salibacterium salarium TaxID=284579 RepID=UPI002789E03F|nr:L-rhamnose isomerase [Salibacterium salarium]MDQ0300096.1 L-rhamnose isomerase/sugar isomerase [Salibacterium salarium]